jgi:hypothetical protein
MPADGWLPIFNNPACYQHADLSTVHSAAASSLMSNLLTYGVNFYWTPLYSLRSFSLSWSRQNKS